MTVLHNDTPLLVVDVQNGFVNRNSEGVLPNIVSLIETWREADRPIFMSRFLNPDDSQWERLLGWTRLREAPETDLHELVVKAANGNGISFTKTAYSCLRGEFLDFLDRFAPATVVVCGIATDGCVLKSCIDLFEYEPHPVRPIVVSDACASHAGDDVHAKGLHLLGRFIGADQIVTLAGLRALDNDTPTAG